MVSLAIHIGLLVRLSYINSHYLRKPLKSMEVSYYKLKPEKVEKKPIEYPKIIKEETLAKNIKVFSKPEDVSPLIKDIAKLPVNTRLQDKSPLGVEKMRVERKISVPPVKSEKISNPVYLNYYKWSG